MGSADTLSRIGFAVFWGVVLFGTALALRPPSSPPRGGVEDAAPTATRSQSMSTSDYRTPTPTLEEYCPRGPQEIDPHDYTGATCREIYEVRWEDYQDRPASEDEDRGWGEDEIYRGGPLD